MIGLSDVEALTISALNAAGVTASGRPGDPRAAAFATVRRVGGRRLSVATEQARVAVEFWAQRAPDAATLANTGRAALSGMVSLAAVLAVEEIYVGSIPDQLTGLPRMRVEVDIILAIN